MRTLIAMAAVVSLTLPVTRAQDPASGRPAARPAAARSSALSKDPKRGADETDIVGGVFDPSFRDVSPRGGVLVGFNVGLGGARNNPHIISVRPLYLTPDGTRSGRLWGLDDTRMVSVRARRGYAVGAVTVHPGLLMNGIKVTFMRMKKDGTLDVNDAYDAEWLGRAGGDHCPRLGGDGSLVVGICGRGNNKDCTGLGLILSSKARGQADEGER